jgi:uncharacterized membrane protein
MRGKARLFGHSVHPMLIVFPLGMLTVSWIFDIVHLATGVGTWAHVAFWMLSCGLVGGVAAAIPGLIDYFAIPQNTRARNVATRHLAVNLLAMSFFLTSWLIRMVTGIEDAGVGSLLVAMLGAGMISVSAWYGGELVERLGVGVHADAHLNAPSSLQIEPSLPRREARPMPQEPLPV